MDDPERQDFLRRLDESERARRRWKVLALGGTPILALLLIIAAGNAVSSWFALLEMARQERLERERALQAAEEARREADEARAMAERARLGAKQALKQEQPMPKEP